MTAGIHTERKQFYIYNLDGKKVGLGKTHDPSAIPF